MTAQVSAASYEKLGAFYLGRVVDRETGQDTPEALLYDAKDLTTHAVCVGMTGSGKTGLCMCLLEEAAIDGIPAIAVDMKGDLANLLLTFPGLEAEAFAPWIDPAATASSSQTPNEAAQAMAARWKQGLADWGQDGARIKRLRDTTDLALYTPGAAAGRPLSVLRSFAAPSPAVLADPDALREHILASVSGLMALLGLDADPLQSREHILLSSLLEHAWQGGSDLNLQELIRQIQVPPFAEVGILDLESFYPSKERFKLAMTLNNLLASPTFAAWMEGEPLNVQHLLWTPTGKPRIAVLYIAHLSDTERMFFVTRLLGEVLSWMRAQTGTSSLRALLYLDEVFGYFPPTANPPSKQPMLTLLKQARAFGLGVVLATQNPVDLDYKGLSNAGTWLLGRLQTQRDQLRVIEGLEGAAATGGGAFDRSRMETLLAGLDKRVFLMNNVHEDGPVLFRTRWALSFLAGPLTRTQVQTLVAEPTAPPQRAAQPAATRLPGTTADAQPLLPPDIEQAYVALERAVPAGARVLYRPALLGQASFHFVKASAVDHWEDRTFLVFLDDDAFDDANIWQSAQTMPADALTLEPEGDTTASYASPPASATQPASYARWNKELKNTAYRTQRLTLWRAKALKEISAPNEDEATFRIRLRQAAHEQRDLDVESLRARYATRAAQLTRRIESAKARLDREQAQLKDRSIQTAISVGTTLLGALFGRKRASASRIGTAARGASRTVREKADVDRAQASIEDLKDQMLQLEGELATEIEELRERADPNALELDELSITPRKADITVRKLTLTWTPWIIAEDGTVEPGTMAWS